MRFRNLHRDEPDRLMLRRGHYLHGARRIRTGMSLHRAICASATLSGSPL
ncbi:hypothetical protein [Nocardia mangyaensis]|nr:hypothetical protein [Nocardia mangyaensis]